MPLWIKDIFSWFKYKNHPCYIGRGEFDHNLEEQNDYDGDGVYTMSYSYVECITCGATHDEDKTIPIFLDDLGED